jgi:hypothetical protein
MRIQYPLIPYIPSPTNPKHPTNPSSDYVLCTLKDAPMIFSVNSPYL